MMGGNRSTKSAGLYEHEDFCPATRGDTAASLGGLTGYRLQQDGEYAYIDLYFPKNFAELLELEVVLFSYATATPMYFGVVTNYCQDGEAYTEHNEAMLHKSVNTVLSRRTDLDIMDCVDDPFVEGGDILGIQVNRTAGRDPAHNSDALIVGAWYNMLLKRKAES